MMKFKFDANQEFQLKAVSSIVDIFEGQGKNGRDNFMLQADGIYPNRLDLSPAEIFNNVETVQKRNGISQDVVREMDFSVEMETGTGKTYVYLRAINPKSLFNNPDRFMFEAAKIIKAILIRNYIEQITYELDGDKFNLAQFEQMAGRKTSVHEISNKHKSIYDAVVFSSDVEKNFAVELDKDERIKLFIKLPGWFTVNTPLGGYVPDWAIVTAKIDVAGKESKEKVYFVIETKGTTDEAGRRVFENQKIECAMRHFEVVDVKYKDAADYSDFAREL